MIVAFDPYRWDEYCSSDLDSDTKEISFNQIRGGRRIHSADKLRHRIDHKSGAVESSRKDG